MASVTINVTIRNGEASAPDSEASLGSGIVWMVDGDIQPGDEVTIGHFRRKDGGPGSPMSNGSPRRTGAGPIADSVRNDAATGVYVYDISLVRAGVASVLDPEIQIKP